MDNSKIEWTTHTFNPWWGCMKVSEGCKNCYAQNLDNRYHKADPHWGLGSSRKPQSDAYWKQPLKWNAEAEKAGMPAKVFCASMADVFEGHPDTIEHLNRLFYLIEQTPWLTWQLLTKRPENIMRLVPQQATPGFLNWHREGFPDNVWIGTSVENQKAADERIPHLLKVPVVVRFLSCEPLLGPVDLTDVKTMAFRGAEIVDALDGALMDFTYEICPNRLQSTINWVIAGGESGQGARPMHPDWARSLRDQCKEAGVAFFFKQNGEYVSVSEVEGPGAHYKFTDGATVRRTGKKLAGRTLDGKEYNEFPA